MRLVVVLIFMIFVGCHQYEQYKWTATCFNSAGEIIWEKEGIAPLHRTPHFSDDPIIRFWGPGESAACENGIVKVKPID